MKIFSNKKMEVDEQYVRSREEINEAIKLANIEESELKKLSQVLLPTEADCGNRYKLIELDSNLAKVLNEGTCLSFRGQKHEQAVLCTQDRTYDILEAETSNTLLLIPDVKLGNDIKDVCNNPEDRIVEERRIRGQLNTYYELTECKPKFGELLALLEPSAFKGIEYEKHLDPETLYDWEKLQSHVRASDDEIRCALSEYLIANIDGYYRHISFEFEARALTLMLDLMDENSWAIDEVDRITTFESLKELIPRPAFDVIFDRYTEPSDKRNEKGETLYRYNEEKTCKFLAQILLAASPVNDYKHFMESWRIGAPDQLKPKPEYLRGIALIMWNPQKMKKEVISFPESSLSENIVTRLNELFKVKDSWTVDEITPYIKRCTTQTADVNALLTTHARRSTVNGVKVYSSKYEK